jgi:hypothetical protein
MTEKHYNQSTPNDQSEIEKTEIDQLEEQFAFLAGALSCTINLEDKDKIPGALELCIELVRDIYQQVEIMALDKLIADKTLNVIDCFFKEPGFGSLSNEYYATIKDEVNHAIQI